MKNKKASKLSRNSVLALVIVLVLIAASIVVLSRAKESQRNDAQEVEQAVQRDNINFDPPTEEDKQNVEEHKKYIADQQENKPNLIDPTTGKNKVNLVITYAGVYEGNLEVGAYINVVEENGTCTLTLTKDGEAKSVSVNAVNSAASTDCPVMVIPSSQVSPGSWQAAVSYSSSASIGYSELKTIEVK